MVFLVNLARVVFAPLIEPLSVAFEVTPAALGVVATAAWLGSAALRLPAGWVLTRIPRHHVILATGAMLVASALATAFASSIPVLAVGAFAMGLSSGAYFIAANPLVSELFPERVGRALGVHGMASQTAAVVAPLAVSAVLLVGDWRLTFLAIAVVALLATVGMFLAARGADLPDAGARDRDMLAALRAQWPIILTGVAFIGAIGFVWNGLFNYYVTYLKVSKGLAEPTARTLLTVLFAAGIPAFFVSGRLADRLPNLPFLFAVLGGFVACVLALTAAAGLWQLVAATVVLGYVIHSLFPALDTYLLSSLPDHHRGSAYALYSGSMMPLQAFGSMAVGTLVGSGWAFDAVFRTLAGGLVAVLVALVGLYLVGWLPTGGAARAASEH
jgi:DHA1 family inner membrane transport protein